MSAQSRFEESLNLWPSPGSGCHVHMMSVCNLGVWAGLSDSEIITRIWETMPRQPDPGEIENTLRKARSEVSSGVRAGGGAGGSSASSSWGSPSWSPRDRAQERREKEERDRRIRAEAVTLVHQLAEEMVFGGRMSLGELAYRSPVPLCNPALRDQQRHNAARLLRTLHDLLRAGLLWPRVWFTSKLATVEEWCGALRDIPASAVSSHSNAMTGAGGRQPLRIKISYRCDAAVLNLAHALFEIDSNEYLQRRKRRFCSRVCWLGGRSGQSCGVGVSRFMRSAVWTVRI